MNLDSKQDSPEDVDDVLLKAVMRAYGKRWRSGLTPSSILEPPAALIRPAPARHRRQHLSSRVQV